MKLMEPALFEDGRDFSLQESERMFEWGFNSLGSGNFIYLVSSHHRWKKAVP